jgi:hypothetical protein
VEVELLGRRQDDLGLERKRPLQPVGDIPRDGAQLARLAERDPVEAVHGAAQRPRLRIVAELAQLGAVEVVRLAELVHEPDDLVRVAHGVGGELRADHEVDRATVRLLEVDEAPEEGLGQDALARVPLERDGDERRFVAARAQLVGELLREDLGAAVCERHLGRADGDPHLRAKIA